MRETPPKSAAGWERVGDRQNALNFIRFILATLVLVDHSFPLSGSSRQLTIAGRGLGTWCVAGFFCLSGYLISGSRVRVGALAYLWRRCLRIFPGLVVALGFTALILSPIASHAHGAGPWHASDAVHYLIRNTLLYNPPFNIGNTLSTVPYANAWNGSLWTLFYEFSAYLAVGLILTFTLLRRYAALIFGAILVVTSLGGPTVHDHVANSTYQHAFFLGGFFIAGAFMWAIRERVPLNLPLGLSAIGLLVLTAYWEPTDATWSALPLAYTLLWLGSALPIRWFSANDISYGVYIYAFPIQQMVTLVTGNRNPYTLMAVAMVITICAAYGSWRLVEKPALRLKKLVP